MAFGNHERELPIGYSLKMSITIVRSGSEPSALGTKHLGGSHHRGHARVDTRHHFRRSPNQESFADVIVQGQPAIDAADQHQAAELVGADHAIVRLQRIANLVDAWHVDRRARRFEPVVSEPSPRH